MMKKYIPIMTLVICLILPFSAFAGAAMDTVQGHVNKVLDVLRDTSSKTESAKKAKKDKLRAIADDMFDFTELSKRTLAINWSKFDSEQQKEFMKLYKTLLADTYADKILTYTNEKIVFSKEVPLTDKTVEVRSSVVRKPSEVPINYRVILKADGWRVYDVVVEGVSLINNYRSQFREILMSKPPESLLETLRKKVNKA
jgi:phospholipid transport system substrate-binding protein